MFGIFKKTPTWMPRLLEWADNNNIERGELNWRLPLRSIDLSSKKLNELPKEFWMLAQITQIITLDLSRNNLTELPKEIEQLTELITLNLSSNNLTELPKGTGQLKNLRSLDLSSNNLTELPKEIGQFKYLNVLDLSRNNLTKLPKEIFGQSWGLSLTNIEYLGLSNNNLTELPKEIEQLKIRRWLDLSENPNLVLTPRQEQWINELKITNPKFRYKAPDYVFNIKDMSPF